MEAMSQDEDLANESSINNFNTSEAVVQQLKNIAESGSVDVKWPDLQRALKLRLENVLDHYIERNRDSKEEQYQEPNVEKFNLENSRDEILELIASFNEAPFTIQRICELLYSPFKYYDRISTFLRGLEKNLRVISSINWPKIHNDPRKHDITSNNRPEPQQVSESQESTHHNLQIDTDIETEAASDNISTEDQNEAPNKAVELEVESKNATMEERHSLEPEQECLLTENQTDPSPSVELKESPNHETKEEETSNENDSCMNKV